MTDRGTYIEIEGRPAVRFERTYPHAVERVWRAVTDESELPRWFPSVVHYEARVGGRIAFSDDPYAVNTEGAVLVWEPPHRFCFGWGDDELRLTLTATDEGCRLELVDVLAHRDEASRNGAGWHVCLHELRKWLDDEQSAGPHSDDALPWWPLYEEYVTSGVPSGAAVPDSV